jgi:hypothetical protein
MQVQCRPSVAKLRMSGQTLSRRSIRYGNRFLSKQLGEPAVCVSAQAQATLAHQQVDLPTESSCTSNMIDARKTVEASRPKMRDQPRPKKIGSKVKGGIPFASELGACTRLPLGGRAAPRRPAREVVASEPHAGESDGRLGGGRAVPGDVGHRVHLVVCASAWNKQGAQLVELDPAPMGDGARLDQLRSNGGIPPAHLLALAVGRFGGGETAEVDRPSGGRTFRQWAGDSADRGERPWAIRTGDSDRRSTHNRST